MIDKSGLAKAKSAPEAALEPEEPKAADVCGTCGGEIYKGEVYGLSGGEAICTGCLADMWNGLTNSERLSLLGYTPAGGPAARREAGLWDG